MSVAKTYARALYESAKDAKTGTPLDKVDAQLGEFVKMMESSKDARVALFSPVAAATQKVAIIEAIAEKAAYEPLVARFLCLLARKGRMAEVAEIHEALRAVRLEMEGGVLGRVVAADPVENADIEGLAKAFSKKLGKKVEFQVSTDPSLLAGMKVTVNGVTYDGTLRSQLQRLRDQVTLARG